MWTWLDAAFYCEETYGSPVNLNEEFFVCPECGEMIYKVDWDDHYDWYVCPICAFNFEEGE